MSKMQQQVASISAKVDDKANDLFALVTGFNPSHYFKQYLPVYQTHTPGKSTYFTQNQLKMFSRYLFTKYDPLCPNGPVC